jgi:hypothetical protein
VGVKVVEGLLQIFESETTDLSLISRAVIGVRETRRP